MAHHCLSHTRIHPNCTPGTYRSFKAEQRSLSNTNYHITEPRGCFLPRCDK